MTTYYLDCARMTDRDVAHDYLREQLPLPDWYGRNLDALYDSLFELPPCRIELLNAPALAQLGDYGAKLLAVFRDAARESRSLSLGVHGMIG